MIKNTLSYLITGTHNVLPSSYTKLRSYLNTYSSILAEQHQFKVFKKNAQCPCCFTSWDNDINSFKLLPAKKLKSQKPGKSNQSDIAHEPRNNLVLKCSVCKQRSTFSLVKKKYVKAKPQVEEKIRKKKKRKKDKFSGLLVSLKSTNESTTPLFSIKKKKGVSTLEDSETESSVKITESTIKKTQSKTPLNLPSKNKLNSKNNNKKQLLLNPFAAQIQNRNKNKKLKELKSAIKGNDNAARKTLKDFLTPI